MSSTLATEINKTGTHTPLQIIETAYTHLNEKNRTLSNLLEGTIVFHINGYALTFSVVPVINANPS